ncbi:MAG: hypothetical protein IJK42_13930 [Prevotella sp.]|nr:hypothetical protein [Prevotella sp.]MBQ6210845.1 hypothetical protein [Prevotella sp.]
MKKAYQIPRVKILAGRLALCSPIQDSVGEQDPGTILSKDAIFEDDVDEGGAAHNNVWDY